MLTSDLEVQLGIEIKIMDENQLTEQDKKNNIIIIGYPSKNNLMKDMDQNCL